MFKVFFTKKLISLFFFFNLIKFIKSTEFQHVEFIHKQIETKTHIRGESYSGCPLNNIFNPCDCYEVSFDGETYHTQITCKEVDGNQIKQAFKFAIQEARLNNYNINFDILEIKDVPLLNLCCDDLTDVFNFKTIKIIDSKLCDINKDAFKSIAENVQEFVLMDIYFVNNLNDGNKLFKLIKEFKKLQGVYIISSNLKEIPQNAFVDEHGEFGSSLQVVRVCNSLITEFHDFTFYNLPNILWLDFGDNRINQISSKAFSFKNSQTDATLRISLSGNRLTSAGIDQDSFQDIKRTVDIYLNSNQLTTLHESVWRKLLIEDKLGLLHLKENPLICDCRHYWLIKNSEQVRNLVIDAVCELDKISIFEKSFKLCEKSPLLEPFGDVYRKCCRQIQYKNSFDKPFSLERVTQMQQTDIGNSNQQLIDQKSFFETQKLHFFPAVVIKKPLKYKRLIIKQKSSNSPFSMPNHQTILADSSVPHEELSKHLNEEDFK